MADADPGEGGAGRKDPPFPFVRALRAAIAWLVGPDDPAAADLAHGTAFLPALGGLVGLALGLVAVAASDLLPGVLLAPLLVMALAVIQRGGGPRAILEGTAALLTGPATGAGADAGVESTDAASPASDSGGVAPRDAESASPVPGLGALSIASLAVAFLLVAKALAIAALHGRALGIALVLAGILGRWAQVVQAYGSIPRPGDSFAEALCRGCAFREFGIASVSAMLLVLALANAVGLVLLFAVAAGTIALRILAHRRGGPSRTSIEAGGELAETTTLLLAALLARLIAPG
ncbi:MAG: hypothetical protein ACKOCT_10375 [Alphaproteobacteria bacterium]